MGESSKDLPLFFFFVAILLYYLFYIIYIIIYINFIKSIAIDYLDYFEIRNTHTFFIISTLDVT